MKYYSELQRTLRREMVNEGHDSRRREMLATWREEDCTEKLEDLITYVTRNSKLLHDAPQLLETYNFLLRIAA